MKAAPLLLVVVGLVLIGAAFANPSFAVLQLNSSGGGNVSYTVTPSESSSPASFSFSQSVSGSSTSSYSVSQTYTNAEVWGHQTVSLGMAFPVGQYNDGLGSLYSIGSATVVLTVGSHTYSWSQAFNAQPGSGAWATITPSFSLSQSNYLGSVSIKLTVTNDGSATWSQSLPSGTVTSISSSSGIQSGLKSPPSSQGFGISGYSYSPASISFSNLLSSNVLSYTLNWKSTEGISIQYNGNTQTGTSGSFTNSPPSVSSVVTNIQTQNGASYTVTLSLGSIVYQNTQSGITNAGHFYIDTGSQWVQVTPTAVIKITESSFPANISFAYVEDNGTTSGASYAYIIAGGLQYNIPFSNATTIAGYSAYTIQVPFQTAGNYTINGFLESSTSGGGSLQLMSLTWNSATGTGSSNNTGGNTSPGTQPPVNYVTLGFGAVLVLGGAYLFRRFGL